MEELGDEIPQFLSIIECHQDEGHPEYTKDILYNLIDRLLNNNCIQSDYADKAKLGLEIAEPDRKCWEKICRNFLKG
ncbi:hypothetical protein Patl1_14454 [Pistacia atlantica]|uniref:Uncharacterized protein n=1 Tax=Pistacia atlantica TaxID=434234 RepID=A0ACC1AW62_9ROSI|nr:hypothetical protein Patl1_14454 [Pistacia atlantica]